MTLSYVYKWTHLPNCGIKVHKDLFNRWHGDKCKKKLGASELNEHILKGDINV